MRAVARLVAEADGRGGTRLTVLHGESPLLPRRTGRRGGAGLTVHLVGGAAGPLRGDDLRLEIEVGPGAELTVRSVAAQLALPGRPGLPASRLSIAAAVAAAGTLRWLPEPLIAAAGCDHRTETRVDVAEGGILLWRDDLVCGRHGEPSGAVRTAITVRYAGVTLYRHELAVGPHAPGWSGAAVLGRSGAGVPGSAVPRGSGAAVPRGSGAALSGGGRAVGMVIAVAPGLPGGFVAPGRPDAFPALDGGSLGSVAALMPLAGPGVLATAVGEDIRGVRAALDPICASPAARTGHPTPILESSPHGSGVTIPRSASRTA